MTTDRWKKFSGYKIELLTIGLGRVTNETLYLSKRLFSSAEYVVNKQQLSVALETINILVHSQD